MVSFFKRVFQRKNVNDDQRIKEKGKTAPLIESQVHPEFTGSSNFEPAQLVVACSQSPGSKRDQNEDTLFTYAMTLGNNSSSLPLGLFIVADGMGGHLNGEVASNVAARTFASFILKKFLPALVDEKFILEDPVQEIIQSAMKEAQLAITRTAPGSGTTLTSALVMGDKMTLAHVGDSRAYTFSQDGHLTQLTRDHSLVHRLEELGQISADEAINHPQRNVLYRALGQGEYMEPDVFTVPFPKRGCLLICSDGLWGVVPHAEIEEILTRENNIQIAGQKLVARANDLGGPDNISAILVQLLN